MLNINICRGDLPYILAETKIQIGNMLLIISAQVCVSVFISVDVSVWTPWKLFILIFKNYIFTGSNLSQNYVLIIMRTKLQGLRSRPSLCKMIHISISPNIMILHTCACCHHTSWSTPWTRAMDRTSPASKPAKRNTRCWHLHTSDPPTLSNSTQCVGVRLYPPRKLLDQRGCVHILRSWDVNTFLPVDRIP